MKIDRRWFIVFLLIVCLNLSACASAAPKNEKIQPVRLEKIDGTDLNRVILTERAVERLDIQTAPVVEQIVPRSWVVAGEVVTPRIATSVVKAPVAGTVFAPPDVGIPQAGTLLVSGQVALRLSPSVVTTDGQSFIDVKAPDKSIMLRRLVSPGQQVEAGQALFEVSDSDQTWVSVSINTSDLNEIDQKSMAQISILDNDDEADEENSLQAELIDDVGDDDTEDGKTVIYYLIQKPTSNLAAGQRVMVEVALTGSETMRKVIPYSAIIYDLHGATWVYINPEPLVFIRQAVTVDYIVGDVAVLSEGPATGTAVATVGVPELHGADTGVGK